MLVGVGNEMMEGDLVALSLERPLIFGTIDEIQLGGIVTGIKGGQADVRLTKVVLLSKHIIDVDPRSPVLGALLKLHDPKLGAQERPPAPAPAVIEGTKLSN